MVLQEITSLLYYHERKQGKTMKLIIMHASEFLFHVIVAINTMLRELKV